jgi:hypothetical protein
MQLIERRSVTPDKLKLEASVVSMYHGASDVHKSPMQLIERRSVTPVKLKLEASVVSMDHGTSDPRITVPRGLRIQVTCLAKSLDRHINTIYVL